MNMHTPGPWQWRQNHPRAVYMYEVEAVDGKSTRIACIGDCYPDERDAAMIEQQQANARLIAAAPELLEACKRAIAFLSLGPDYNPQNVAEVLWSAIDKAEGR
jgi:hypothetical protein